VQQNGGTGRGKESGRSERHGCQSFVVMPR